MKIIALEGGMGSGKSAIGKQLRQEGYYYFPEAISSLLWCWISEPNT